MPTSCDCYLRSRRRKLILGSVPLGNRARLWRCAAEIGSLRPIALARLGFATVLVAVASAVSACATWSCCGEVIPAELWIRSDQPELAWVSCDATQALPCVIVTTPPIQIAGGSVLPTDPRESRWVRCHEGNDTDIGFKWARYYLIDTNWREVNGVQWARFRAEE